MITAGTGLAFWPALALLAPQAFWVRRHAPRFAPPPGACEGLVGSGMDRPLRLLGLGDSVVAGVGAGCMDRSLVACTAAGLSQRLDRPVCWEARGRIGARVADVLPWLPRGPVDFILLSAGINDVTAPATLARWRGDLERVLEALARVEPAPVAALVGLPPLGSFPLLPSPLRSVLGARAGAFDRVAQGLAKSAFGMLHLPLGEGLAPEQFAADGYHPSAASHAELGREAGQAMAAAWREREQERGAGVRSAD